PGLAFRARACHLRAAGADGAARLRRLCLFIGNLVMRRPARTRSVRPPKAERQMAPGSRRDRLAVRLALVTLFCLGAAFILSQDSASLLRGRLTSSHGAIENCSPCHTKSGSGKLSWIHGLVAGDPLGDTQALCNPPQIADADTT